jgi:hypothetical protein
MEFILVLLCSHYTGWCCMQTEGLAGSGSVVSFRGCIYFRILPSLLLGVAAGPNELCTPWAV